MGNHYKKSVCIYWRVKIFKHDLVNKLMELIPKGFVMLFLSWKPFGELIIIHNYETDLRFVNFK